MDNVDEIKQKIDIISLISEYVPLKKAGRNFKAPCPFHHEKTPSFVVSPERQIWHCFGCNLGGDCFEFLEKIENIEFAEALRILAKKAGVKLEQVHFDQGASLIKEKLYQINHLASEYYYYLLLNHEIGKKALDYISQRGITKKSLEVFKIGYAPNAWEGVSKFLLKKGYSVDDLEQAGLIIRDKIKKSYYDRFRGRLMFTLKDHRGNVVGFAGRKLPPENEDEAKYINTPETAIYIKGNILYGLEITKEAIRKENYAVVVEGEIDAISSYQVGVSNVVAIKGSALTEGHLNLLKRFCETLYLSLDADLAGDMAARRGIELAEKIGFTIKVVKLLAGKDPNDCIKKDSKLWRESLKNSVPIYDFYLNSALAKYPSSDVLNKKKITQEILPILSKIDNLIVRDHYLKLLSQELDVNIDVLLLEMKRTQKEEKLSSSATSSLSPSINEKNRRDVLEEYLVALILQNDHPISWEKEISGACDYVKNEALRKIITLVLAYDFKDKKWDIKKFANTVPVELIYLVDKLFLFDLKVKNEDEQLFELKGIIKRLDLLTLKEKLQNLGENLKQTKDEKEQQKLSQLFEETAQKIKQLESSQT